MKKIALLLLPMITYCQIGINTTSPSNDLDVNGGLRIRNLTDGSLESDFQGNLYSVPYKIKSIGIITESGVILKSYNVQSVELIGTDTYRITFVNPMPDNNYVVLLSSTRNVSYKNRTANYFDVEVDYFIGQFDFNFIIINL